MFSYVLLKFVLLKKVRCGCVFDTCTVKLCSVELLVVSPSGNCNHIDVSTLSPRSKLEK